MHMQCAFCTSLACMEVGFKEFLMVEVSPYPIPIIPLTNHKNKRNKTKLKSRQQTFIIINWRLKYKKTLVFVAKVYSKVVTSSLVFHKRPKTILNV